MNSCTDTTHGLSSHQVEALLRPLDSTRVQNLKGQSHLASWDVRRWLLRIFGWGGWSFQVASCDLVAEHTQIKPGTENQTPPRYQHTVVYRVIGRLTLHCGHGVTVMSFEDGATGDAQNLPTLGDAHDFALKTAMSQALKRCAINLGDQFGLSLYNNGNPSPVVLRTVSHGFTPDPTDTRETPVAGDTEIITEISDEAPPNTSATPTDPAPQRAETADRDADAMIRRARAATTSSQVREIWHEAKARSGGDEELLGRIAEIGRQLADQETAQIDGLADQEIAVAPIMVGGVPL